MNIKALAIFLGGPTSARRVHLGLLLQYAEPEGTVVNRFIASSTFRAMPQQPTLSLSLLAADANQQEALWSEVASSRFNGRFTPAHGWLLPTFFQNLLPEGALRKLIAERRGVAPDDHFEILAACGQNLPGDIYAAPTSLAQGDLDPRLIGSNPVVILDVAPALANAFSLAGVQPKLAVAKGAGRYHFASKDDPHLIAKLPVPGHALMPELEELSLRLARAAGVSVADAYLEPLSLLEEGHGLDLGETDATTQMLLVVRYDRGATGRVHCEDFAQVLGLDPQEKYGLKGRGKRPTSYLDVARVLLAEPALGEPAVHELLRRLVVNEMLGNIDMHAKNIGLLYTDSQTPEFPPAYDVVCYGAQGRKSGHALHILPPDLVPGAAKAVRQGLPAVKQQLSPSIVRAFCSALGLPEKPAGVAITSAVRLASTTWPDMIASSVLPKRQRGLLLKQLTEHPLVMSLAKRRTKAPGALAAEPVKDWKQPNLFG